MCCTLLCGLVGCDYLGPAKREVARTFAQVLNVCPNGKVLQLPPADPNVTRARLVVHGVPLTLPAFEERTFPKSEDAILKYPQFVVVVRILPDAGRDLAASPWRWGVNDLEAKRAIFALNESDLMNAKSKDEFSRVAAAIGLKGILLQQISDARLTEFRSSNLQGFIHGGIAAGSQRVHFEGYPTAPQTLGEVLVTFVKMDADVKDVDLERYVGAIEVDWAALCDESDD
jgi:hypothetical protein